MRYRLQLARCCQRVLCSPQGRTLRVTFVSVRGGTATEVPLGQLLWGPLESLCSAQ